MPLCALPGLFSIQVTNFGLDILASRISLSQGEPWDEEFLMKISAQHESIRKVYLCVSPYALMIQYGYLIWILSERWTCSGITYLTSDAIAQSIV